MPRVVCTLPYASDEISGVKFSPGDAGSMLSEEISDDAAARFLSIPGYEPYVDESAEKGEKDALLERAQAVGLSVVKQWGVNRLRKEVEEAEAKKAA